MSYWVWFWNWKFNEEFWIDDYFILISNFYDVVFFFFGIWNYEFCVVVMNGNLIGGIFNSVIFFVYFGFESKCVVFFKNVFEVVVFLLFLNEFYVIEGMLLDKEMSIVEDGR